MSAKPSETTPVESSGPIRTVAVIDMGTASIRLAVAEILPNGSVRKLESLSQAVNLGRDTFTRGAISTETTEDCVQVLRSYRKILREYQIDRPEQVRVVATSAVREASNSLAFIDRIYIGTGFPVEPLEPAEVNHLTYLTIQPLLKAEPALGEVETLVMEVGGGSTELLAIRGANVVFSETYRLGSLRLRETLEALHAPVVKVRKMMEQQIERTIDDMAASIPRDNLIELVGVGGDVRFAARKLIAEWDSTRIARLPIKALEQLTDKILGQTTDQLVRKQRLSYPEAETLGPALLAYVLLAKRLELKQLLVTNVSLRDGLLIELAAGDTITEEFSNQIIRSATDLGRKFQFDEVHATHVAKLAGDLFHQLQAEHMLSPRTEVILRVAALLHEVGLYISQRSYHKHSLYLIRNSDMFGLSRRDLLLAALVARYHRRASPQPSHEGYNTLDRDQRVTVQKLAAILRLADALDESRSQRIKEIKCQRDEDRLIITVPQVEDVSLEQLTLRAYGSLFEETFGLSVLLRIAPG